LHGALIDKSLLYPGQLAVAAFALYRSNGSAVCPNRQVKTGIGGHLIDQHCARAAFTHGTALFNADHSQLLPQYFQQRLADIYTNLFFFPVHSKSDGTV
jgi:hypothetical protein